MQSIMIVPCPLAEMKIEKKDDKKKEIIFRRNVRVKVIEVERLNIFRRFLKQTFLFFLPFNFYCNNHFNHLIS